MMRSSRRAPQLLDPEVSELVVLMSRLHGVQTTNSCSGHGRDPLAVFFNVDPADPRGLFLLARGADARYWEHGHLWGISVSVCDAMATIGDRKILPISYQLHSGRQRGQRAYDQAKSLVESILFYAKHKPFVREYDLPDELLEPSEEILRLARRPR